MATYGASNSVLWDSGRRPAPYAPAPAPFYTPARPSSSRTPGAILPPPQQSIYPALPPASQGLPPIAMLDAAGRAVVQQQDGGAAAGKDAFFGPLGQARKTVDDWQVKDAERVPELGDLLNASASSSYALPPNPVWAPFIKRKTVHLPDSLFEQYNLLQCRCAMGLFPEINRAWVTINNKLVLWDYVNGFDSTDIEEEQNVIVSVGLVSPKPGVFVDEIKHVLVTCTPVSVSLLGVAFAPAPSAPAPPAPSQSQSRAPSKVESPELLVYLTGMTVQTDGVEMLAVAGSRTGRVFMCGNDGGLYELRYQAEEGWFRSKCSLVNHSASAYSNLVPSFFKPSKDDPIISLVIDDARNCLYTLSSKSAIELYYLGKYGQGLARVARAAEIGKQATMLCPGSPALDQRAFAIKRIAVVGPLESRSVHLVAITSTGVRLYFTHQRRTYGYYGGASASSTSNAAPTGLELIHVRPPPIPTQLAAAQDPSRPPPAAAAGATSQASGAFSQIETAAYSNGLLLAANPDSEDFDILFGSGPDAGRIGLAAQAGGAGLAGQRPTLIEDAATSVVEGRSWAIAEEPHPLAADNGASLAAFRKGDKGDGPLVNELAHQAAFPPRRFLVLTHMGLSVYAKQRPVDLLRGVLEMSGGREQDVIAFFDNFGREQSCAMALALASGSPLAISLGPDLYPSTSAASAAPGNHFSPDGAGAATAGSITADVALQARRLFYEYGGRPVSIERGYPSAGGSTSDRQVLFSGRHDGLALYLSRLVRPIWKQKVTKLSPTPQNPNCQAPYVSEKVLEAVQRDLAGLQAFLKSNQQLFATNVSADPRDRTDQAAWKAEQASLAAMDLLMTQCIEGISFILLLIDYQLPETIAHCDPALQKQLLGLTYQDLLTTPEGREVARSIVNEVINQQIARQISVDAISEVLQQRCGSFCSADDVLLYKAIENIRKARETRDPAERRDSLRESLRLFNKAARHLSLDKLKEVTAEYRSLRFPTGAIDLPLTCAREWDANEDGLRYWADGMPENDPRKAAYDRRVSCYECIFETLEDANEQLNRAVAARTNGSGDSVEEAEVYRSSTFQRAFEATDPVFHSCLYDWLISKGLKDQLLEIQSPYLESHLLRDPLTLEKCELLWQYWVRRAKYHDAARVLTGLAESTEFPLTLSRRVEYLSLAVSNVKSHQPSRQNVDVEFMTDVEEKLEVAQVQVEVYRAIVEHTELEEDRKAELLALLDQRLFNISELFRDFAEPLQLLDIILLIFHTSDFHEPELVATTWDLLIARAHESAEGGEPHEGVAATVIALGRRFYPSDVAFPLDIVVNMLEKYSYEHQVRAVGWVPFALREAGVPYDAIFAVMDEMFEAQIPPWQTPQASAFLIADIAALLEAWLREATSSGAGAAATLRFPAARIDDAITAYLNALSSGGGGDARVREKLVEIQRAILAKF